MVEQTWRKVCKNVRQMTKVLRAQQECLKVKIPAEQPFGRERAESSSSSSPTVRPCKTVRAGKEVVTMKKATKISPFFGRRKLLQTILIF